MQRLTTFRDPILSLWQSAVQQAERNRRGLSKHPGSIAAAELFAAATLAINEQPEVLPHGLPIGQCVSLLASLALAEIAGRQREADALGSRLRMSSCDPMWAESLAVYLRHRAARRAIPYIRHRSMDDFVIPMPERIRIALVADWGAGNEIARWVLEQATAHRPDMLIHLGDIYYAGTDDEIKENFLRPLRELLGTIPIYSLAGNHDMYAGGAPYYRLLRTLRQPASYFALRNRHWQILGMDTALNDSDPFTAGAGLTFLEPSEAAWHLDKINGVPARCRSIVLSHHQLFTPFGDGVGRYQGQEQAINTRLLAPFASAMERIPLWLWGHEHDLVLYDPYLGLEHGRCIGAGSIPVAPAADHHRPNMALEAGGRDLPRADSRARLDVGQEGIYNHCYAILDLEGHRGEISYFQVDALGRKQSQMILLETL